MPEMTYEEIMDLIRELRHDFLNNIQVIMGNLQLKKAERAEDYCRQVISQILPLGPLGKLDNAYLSLSLLLLLQRAKSLDVDLRIEAAPQLTGCADLSISDSDGCRALAERLLEEVATLSPENRWLQLNLGGQAGECGWEMRLAPGPKTEAICRQVQQAVAGDFVRQLNFSSTPQAARISYRLP